MPRIKLEPYLAIRLNFTNFVTNDSIRNMAVKLWMTNELNSFGVENTSHFGTAVWYVPKRFIQINQTNQFYFATNSTLHENLRNSSLLITAQQQPWYEGAYKIVSSSANGVLQIKLQMGSDPYQIPGAKLFVYMGSDI
jgi:hypothetical protein